MTRSQAARGAPWTDIADKDLLALIKMGETGAFGALMQRYNRRLYRVARNVTGNDGEAEDVVQEAWTRAYAHIGEFRGEARLSTWLTRITLNEAIGRKRWQRPHCDESGGHETGMPSVITFPATASDPESDLSRAQVRRMLEVAVDTLPPPFRAVFVMREIEEMSAEEVALHWAFRK